MTQLFLVLLTVLFIGLKLTAHIDWSWWLVLLPAYFGMAAWFVLVSGLFAIAGVNKLIKNYWK